MTLTFGPYSLEVNELSRKQMREIGVSKQFLDTYFIPFLEYIIRIPKDKAVHAKAIAKDGFWKPDGAVWERDDKIKKLRRAAWYYGIPVGTISVGRSDRDGFFWPLCREEFRTTVKHNECRFIAAARNRKYLRQCPATIDVLANQLKGMKTQIMQGSLFTEEVRV